MAKLKSTAVKVYPSAFRGLATGMKYNPEARLNTEFNVTNLINRLASKDSFVISWNPTTNVIIFNIHGYYFENNLTEFLSTGAGSTWTNVYARIRLLPFLNDEGEPSGAPNTKYKAITLAGTSDVGTIPSPGVILDVTTSSIDTFFGIDLNDSATSSLESTDYELHLLSGGPSAWAVPLTSRLKFVATDVEGLPTINNSTTLKTNNTIFAPITAGTAGQLSVSQGGTLAPTWISTADVVVGEATQAVQLKTSRNLWGRPFNGTAAISGAITGTGNITPTTNNTSNIGASDNVYANVFATTFTGNVTGNISGNAETVTNGVYTSGNQTIGGTKTFSSKITGSISGNADGNAGTVTNGVYTTGDQTIGGTKTFSNTISGSINGNAATATNVAYSGLTGTVPTWNQNTTGNAATATNVAYSGLTGTVPTWNQNTTGTASNVTGTVAVANGGTGQTSIAAARNAFGLGNTTGALPVANGGTGAANASDARTNLGLGSVTNESKATMFTNPTFTGTVSGVTATHVGLSNVTNHAQIRKLASSTNGNVPIWGNTSGDILSDGYTVQTALSSSTTALVRADAIQTALNLKSNLASPTFTGSPAAPTAANTTNDTQIATTAFVRNKFTDFSRYNRISSQTAFLTSTSYVPISNLGVALKIYTHYRFKIYILYTRNGGNPSSVYLSPYGDYLGGPGPSGYFISQYNATNTATALTIQGLKTVNASAPSDASSLQLPTTGSSVSLSFAILEGTYYTGNSTSMSVAYRMSTGGSGGISFWDGSYIIFEEIVT